MSEPRKPSPGAIKEASGHPSGYVYEIGGGLDPDGAIPPEAIVGAWQVGADGVIVGAFIPNPDYDAARWPVMRLI